MEVVSFLDIFFKVAVIMFLAAIFGELYKQTKLMKDNDNLDNIGN